MVMDLRNRFPSFTDIYAVFSVSVFLIYSWSLWGFFYRIPSLMLYLPLGEIMAVLAYMLAVALIESIVVTIGLVVLGFVLPGVLLREGFVYKGFLVLLVSAVAVILLQTVVRISLIQIGDFYRTAAWSFAVLLILFFGMQKSARLKRGVMLIVDQLEIFTYLYVPLGVISFLVVIIRNLF